MEEWKKIDLKRIYHKDIDHADSCQMLHVWKSDWKQIQLLFERNCQAKGADGRNSTRDPIFRR
jgi:hypothetical protein